MAMNEVQILVLPDGRMDRKNAAKYLGLSDKGLANMACQGRGPQFFKRGRVWYLKKDLDAWLTGGAVQRKPLELVTD